METTQTPIRVSAPAAQEIKRLIVEHKLPETAGVRVGVRGGGCSGFSYALNFDYDAAEGDVVFNQDGVRVFCDPKSYMFLKGATLEYSEGLQGKGFHFVNPNAKGSCGCGESFSV
ncbi:MAG: iron-sulfur cluster assembly accessory protein [Planctomycetota bacterium]|nr:MAG: iron-sulfur cluster assembly accessory protein [Planctomycetota bacterium]